MKILLGAAIAAAFALVIGWWNAKVPHLTFTVSDTIPFRGDKNQFGIINATVINDGSHEADDVECSFLLKDCNIREVKASPDYLNPSCSVVQDKAFVKVRLLNAGESIQISALTDNPDKLPARPVVVVRGKGVVGETVAKTNTIADIVVSIIGIIVMVGFLIAFTASRLLYFRRTRQSLEIIDEHRVDKETLEHLALERQVLALKTITEVLGELKIALTAPSKPQGQRDSSLNT
jgi:hypothetical protein